jgi:hypothetical protein
VAFSFISGGNRSTRRKPLICRNSLTKCITFCYIELYTSLWTGFKLTTLVGICTDCIGRCKSKYHTTTTTLPTRNYSRENKTVSGWNILRLLPNRSSRCKGHLCIKCRTKWLYGKKSNVKAWTVFLTNASCTVSNHKTVKTIRSEISKRFSELINTMLKVFCDLRTNDKRCFWQLNFGSKLTTVSLLCLPIALRAI